MDPNSTAADSGTGIPRAGMLATVRNRRGLVAAVEPFDPGDNDERGGPSGMHQSDREHVQAGLFTKKKQRDLFE